MDLSFNKVTYDGELSEFSEDELRELIREFETAQESNVAEFEKAAEATEDVDESVIEEFEEARQSVIEEITEAEAFDEVPLTEDKLEDEDFGALQDWQDFVQERAGQTETDEGEGEFDDMGKKAPKQDSEDEADFIDEELKEVQGLSL